VRLGLLEHARIFHEAPGVYLVTRAGLASVDLPLPPARVDLRTYEHDLNLTWLVVDLEREYGPNNVTTEREMRSTDTAVGTAFATSPRFAVPLARAPGQLTVTRPGNVRLHYPDCAVTGTAAGGADAVLAVEFERTPKGRARLARILRGYVAARHIYAVRYYADGDRVLQSVQTEVAAQRAHQLVDVRLWRAPPTSLDWRVAA
jgi:hypothetical protein